MQQAHRVLVSFGGDFRGGWGFVVKKLQFFQTIKAIYFSKKAIRALQKHMTERKRSIQIDSYFSEFIRNHPKLSFRQMLPSMGYEETHESLIDKFRDKKGR